MLQEIVIRGMCMDVPYQLFEDFVNLLAKVF